MPRILGGGLTCRALRLTRLHRRRARRPRSRPARSAPSRSPRPTSTGSRAVDGEVHAFLHVDTDGALAAAAAVDARRAAGETLGPLAGVPLALKDVLRHQGRADDVRLARSSRAGCPPYDATVDPPAARRPAW